MLLEQITTNLVFQSNRFIILTVLEIRNLKIKMLAGLYFFWRLRGVSVSCLFSAFRATCIAWLMDPCTIFKTSSTHFIICLSLYAYTLSDLIIINIGNFHSFFNFIDYAITVPFFPLHPAHPLPLAFPPPL